MANATKCSVHNESDKTLVAAAAAAVVVLVFHTCTATKNVQYDSHVFRECIITAGGMSIRVCEKNRQRNTYRSAQDDQLMG